MKRFLISMFAMVMMLSNATFVHASENEILDEILALQEEQQAIFEERVEEIEGDGIPGERNNPIRSQITCYIEAGKKTATGSRKMDGIIAAAPEYIGYVAQVYKVAEDGSLGEFIGYFPVEDTGYGASTGYGQSKLRKGKHLGTIECGITFDFRKPNMTAARGFMKDTYTGEGTTGSEVYIILEGGEG